jgi:hypothetical protein
MSQQQSGRSSGRASRPDQHPDTVVVGAVFQTLLRRLSSERTVQLILATMTTDEDKPAQTMEGLFRALAKRLSPERMTEILQSALPKATVSIETGPQFDSNVAAVVDAKLADASIQGTLTQMKPGVPQRNFIKMVLENADLTGSLDEPQLDAYLEYKFPEPGTPSGTKPVAANSVRSNTPVSAPKPAPPATSPVQPASSTSVQPPVAGPYEPPVTGFMPVPSELYDTYGQQSMPDDPNDPNGPEWARSQITKVGVAWANAKIKHLVDVEGKGQDEIWNLLWQHVVQEAPDATAALTDDALPKVLVLVLSEYARLARIREPRRS